MNGVPTHVFSLQSRAKNSALLLVVPGSPGMGHFYVPFASRLFQLGNGSYDVSVVSHAGHSPGVPREHRFESEEGFESEEDRDWFSLEDQIAHKMAFLEERAAHKDTLYLVGHSIGCFMILRMLDYLTPTRVKKAVFLFPTIEKMASTANGLSQRPLFTTLRSPFTGVVWLLSIFPEWMKRALLQKWFYTTPPEYVDHMCHAVMNIDHKSIHNILCMAEEEMKEVSDLPLETLQQHIDKVVLYYGVGDRWNLDSSYNEMVERFPDKDVNLCSCGYSHAFVLTASDEMADFVFYKLSQS